MIGGANTKPRHAITDPHNDADQPVVVGNPVKKILKK